LILLQLLCWPTCATKYALRVYLFYASLPNVYLAFRAMVLIDVPTEARPASV
jgi:hypothetical protein